MTASTLFAPVEAPTTYDTTLERLGTAIRIGVLAPGDRLPPERVLAERFGISRSTLRQALAQLTASGHLVATRGRAGGTFVAPAPPVASGARLRPEEARAMLDWRMALELGTVQLAAERATDAHRARLAAVSAAPADGEDWGAFRRRDAAFHLLLACAARSQRLAAEMTRVQGELSDLLARVDPDASDRAATAAQHRRVADAVAAGDAEAARRAMRAHLEATARLLDERLGAVS